MAGRNKGAYLLRPSVLICGAMRKLPSLLPFLTENVKRHCSVSSSTLHGELLSLVRRPIQAFAMIFFNASHTIMVDAVVTTIGGIEEDLIKCLAPIFIGDFSQPGAYLRSKGLNRIGNLLVSFINGIKMNELKERLLVAGEVADSVGWRIGSSFFNCGDFVVVASMELMCDSRGCHGEDDGIDSRARSRCAILGSVV
ncbi:hypothetical protein V8G54_030385 [Vigna mungo]|uniref:Uncharacterized protein n=1 Tax=Vigna mungo TaxID=3915 RepID=A0AAQ3MWY7_VIGMU